MHLNFAKLGRRKLEAASRRKAAAASDARQEADSTQLNAEITIIDDAIEALTQENERFERDFERWREEWRQELNSLDFERAKGATAPDPSPEQALEALGNTGTDLSALKLYLSNDSREEIPGKRGKYIDGGPDYSEDYQRYISGTGLGVSKFDASSSSLFPTRLLARPARPVGWTARGHAPLDYELFSSSTTTVQSSRSTISGASTVPAARPPRPQPTGSGEFTGDAAPPIPVKSPLRSQRHLPGSQAIGAESPGTSKTTPPLQASSPAPSLATPVKTPTTPATSNATAPSFMATATSVVPNGSTLVTQSPGPAWFPSPQAAEWSSDAEESESLDSSYPLSRNHT